ncbi:class A beta-lactamase-related serine hydrolase [Prescottella equi]|uniref:Serine hydrolase n=1 Tax=Rhodococcus hoagii TaxID=43767 RepID=A0A9Q5RQL4_RHOHA|nr:serine hydrolase [Prescottella equi]MBM4491353.1 serine hydrolase [Prescottella equi]MBM4495891.1 serine hydrolase [Prescottella equi]MBM4502298.1 serine hydrolase [Prescottella equi]MBM4506151.1 serine hydrolase [Prescottella equi]MBM4512697.1 serine hydrolase [Prescottella equi]
MTATGRVADVFADAAVRGWMHAVPVSGGRAGVDVGVGADDPVVTASVYKLPLVVAFCRLVDAGDLDPREQVTLDPSTRTTGPTGVSQMSDPVRMSLRDMARSMMAMSDNAAADELLRRVGVDRVNETMRSLGLSSTRIVGGTSDILESLVADTGTRSPAEAFAAIGDNDSVVFPRGYDPVLSSATTPRDMTTLLSAVWSGAVLSADQTAFVRAVMASQIFTARLRSGFPFADVVVAGKTGTLGAVRNEVGVIEFPDGDAFAVAVFTRAARADALLPRADAAIGQAARTAIAELRKLA